MSHPESHKKHKSFPWWVWLLFGAGLLAFFYLTSAVFGSDQGKENSSPRVGSVSSPDLNPGLGQTQETRDGIAISPKRVAYNIDSAPSILLGEPLGAFATITFRIENKSSEPHQMFTRQITGTIGESEYDVAGLTDLNGDYLGSIQNINPGLSLELVAYLDIPPGQTLDTFSYESNRISGSKVTFNIR